MEALEALHTTTTTVTLPRANLLPFLTLASGHLTMPAFEVVGWGGQKDQEPEYYSLRISVPFDDLRHTAFVDGVVYGLAAAARNLGWLGRHGVN